MRRLFLLLVLVLVAGARPARAQGGMPDMSKAPADIQAIWKKVMSGSVPTQAEAKKLQDYMAGQRDAIVAGAKARAAAATKLADSVKGANAAATSANAQAACPARSPALASVAASAPSAAGAAQFLTTMKQKYLGQESAAGQHALATIAAKVTDARRLTFIGGVLAADGKAGAAVVVYADAAQKGGPTERASWSGLGAALELDGDDAHAVTAYRRALAIGPRNGLDVYGLGVAYANLGDMATGIPLLTEATHLAPKFGMAWDALGRAQSCTGAMSAAVASMQKAQEVDWIERREAQVSGPESDDDKVEAQKPLPMPPGVAPIPPPAPPAFPFQIPTIPTDWLAARHFDVEMIGVAGEYQNLLTAVGRQEQSAENDAQKEVDAQEAGAAAVAGVEFEMNIDNRREVNAATDRVDRRMAGRQNLIMSEYGDQMKRLANQAVRRWAAVTDSRDKCEAQAARANRDPSVCTLPYCRAALPLARDVYTTNRGAAAVMIGGMAGLAAAYDRTMRAWFMYATNPVTRVRLDADRREQLINIERYIYTMVEQFGLGSDGEQLISTCKEAATAAALAQAATDTAAKAGKCGSKKLSLNVVVGSVSVDCNEFKIGFGIPETPIGFQANLRGATKGRHGELFVGLGNGITGVGGVAVGMQANFDQGGRVTTAGLGVHGTVGNSVIGSEDVEETINLRSSGAATEDSATFTTGAAFDGDLGAISAFATGHR